MPSQMPFFHLPKYSSNPHESRVVWRVEHTRNEINGFFVWLCDRENGWNYTSLCNYMSQRYNTDTQREREGGQKSGKDKNGKEKNIVEAAISSR